MYIAALEWNPTHQPQAIERLKQLMPRAPGQLMPIEDSSQWLDLTGNAQIKNDLVEATGDTPSMQFSAPPDQDASALITSSPISVQPNTLFEISGWVKSSSIYGSGYGVVTVFEDDGNWGHGRTTDLISVDETHGWLPFRVTLTTLPTTQRLFVRQGLFNTFGTFWVDGIHLVQVAPQVVTPLVKLPPCK